ncbi:ABC transporter ATP-binding protein [Chitinasiproducens palmae]|uniref:NitT/TauT family transport system ATP-binding protein n=1 Tax=Chitinasiproducens palmae TaxID=1770053 RepID=A0A1H2PQ90_9BURK|nr:ATP-binding cassette domain-containing protein [Chitinasiproducens palmae]SDV48960.1 NitT/TauT family transport system ATP-binding protein [Chitinasiproducens palmae]
MSRAFAALGSAAQTAEIASGDDDAVARAATAVGGVSVRGLTKYFVAPDGARHAVIDRLSFDVPPGQFVCVLGASGSGKTTLLRLLGGLASPDAGRVDFAAPSSRGFVFQQDALLPWRSVLDNVAFGLAMRGVARAERRRRALALLDTVGLGGLHDQLPNRLSGGMRQRVNLARALAVEPTVLLMDEPFSALDVRTRSRLQGELRDIWRARRSTVIFVTHQIDEALQLGQRVMVLGAGGAGILADLAVPASEAARAALATRIHALIDGASQPVAAASAVDGHVQSPEHQR